MPKFIKGFFGKVFRLMILISLIAEVIILVITTIGQTSSMERLIIKGNKTLAETAAKSIEAGYLDFKWPFETLKKISDSEEILFLWIVKPTGEIFLADDPEMQGKVITDPSLGTREIIAKDSIYHNQKIKLIIHPLEIEVGKKPWSLYMGVSLKAVTEVQRRILFTGFVFFTLAIIIVIPLSFYLAKGITNPLQTLRKGVEIIGKGNLDYRIKVKTGDEIEELAESFNRMAKSLGESQAALEEAKTVLEIKVAARTRELKELAERREEIIAERTKELRERIEELEKFHRLTVGRELKMVELKEEIKKLKKELEKYKKA